MRVCRYCCCCCSRSCGYVVAVIVAFLAAILGKELSICRDREYLIVPDQSGATCELVKGLGACAALPFITRQLCGDTCGWCDPGARAEGRPGEWLDPLAAYTQIAQDGKPRWREVERVQGSTLSYQEFVERYKAPSKPVVFSGLSPLEGNATLSLEEFVGICGDTLIDLSRRPKFQLLRQVEAMGGPAQWVLDYQMRASWGLSIKEIINLGSSKTLRQFVADLTSGSQTAKGKIDYTWLAHFMFPLSLDSYDVPGLCKQLTPRLVVPKYVTGDHLRCPDKIQEFRDWKATISKVDPPTIFLSAASARPYPPHTHASEHHIFHSVLAGRKCFVHWPWEEWRHLYRLGLTTDRSGSNPEGITEDILFLAEGINQSFGSFPGMALSKAYFGCLNAGDMLYLPSGSIHSFESTAAALSLNYYGYDKWSNQNLRRMNEDPGFARLSKRTLNKVLKKQQKLEVAAEGEPQPMQMLDLFDHFCPKPHPGTRKYIQRLFEGTPEGTP